MAVPGEGDRVIRLVRGDETLQTCWIGEGTKYIAGTTRLRFSDGSAYTIDLRLVTPLAMLSDHFETDISLCLEFRPYSPRQFTRHSNHNAGRAIDFTVRGVSNENVRDFCRGLRNTGVGYYPNSAFVHLDVRDASAYWIDYAAAGQPPRDRHPESKDEADEGAGEVEGIATVDSPGGAKSGSDVTSSVAPATAEKENGKSPDRGSGGEHSVFPGQR
jgi:hypothetical protein